MDRKNVDAVLIRMDKLGDLVLSLPVDEHPTFKGQVTHWFVGQGSGFIPRQATPQRRFTEFKRGFSPFEAWRMWRWLRRAHPRTAILFHNPWWVSFVVWLAGVPERIGRRSQWHSLLFLNVGIRQKRSRAERHESDYNFDLVEAGLRRVGHRRTFELPLIKRKSLKLVAPNPLGTIAARDLSPRGYRVVHPGMAGSALNWPQANFARLVQELALEMPVVITGTKIDKKYLVDLGALKDSNNVRWLVGELNLGELGDVLSQARGVVAPSTGVLHLAASLGVPTVGIYSPRRVEHPRRWGPKGALAESLVPPVQDADDFADDVMEQIQVEQVIMTLKKLESRVDDPKS